MSPVKKMAHLRGFNISPMQWLCVQLLFFVVGIKLMVQGSEAGARSSVALETFHHGYDQKLEPRGGWGVRRRFVQGGADIGESYSRTWRSVFRDGAEFGDNTVMVVSLDGTGDYRSVQSAVDQVPDGNTRRVTVYITSGVYEEKVIIPITKPFITLQGEGRNRTVITWNDTADAAGTLMSASVVVKADHFIARDISFKNSAGPPVPTRVNMQAAAFRISGDMAFLYGCNFFGYQDTLYDHEGRHYYYRCLIEGSEDFIFGVARSLFERCWLHSIAEDGRGALVAQGKYYPGSIMGTSGYSFVSCIITGTGRPWLGRAWGQYSTVVYSFCEMDADIIPEGWYDWGLPERARTAYVGQYRCTGRGANTTGRVPWARELTDGEAQPFLSIQFIDGPW
ncbi:hypothetical protein M758_11G101500 [Ceratodon purpureus]|nr:hypothetical protein M758_11G101500 [Ceratodon purpureus]